MTGAVRTVEKQSMGSGMSGDWVGLRHGTVFIQAWDPGFGDKGRNGQVFLVGPFLWSLEWNLVFLSLR